MRAGQKPALSFYKGGFVMASPARRDSHRFRELIKNEAQKKLRNILKEGGIPIQGSKGKFVIPVHEIEFPQFRYGGILGQRGVGQGQGEPGDVVGNEDQDAPTGAGNQPGQHELGVEFSLDELADMLGEELCLPRLQPKHGGEALTQELALKSRARHGMPSQLLPRATFKAALRRSIATGIVSTDDPEGASKVSILPIDLRFRAFKNEAVPEQRAVIVYARDISGSITEENAYWTKSICFYINLWVRRYFPNTVLRYLTHDTEVDHVSEEEFFRRTTSGGTLFTPCYAEVQKMILEEYRPEEWNVYFFHFSDGDPFSEDDCAQACGIIQQIGSELNLFGYGQLSGFGGGMGKFWHYLQRNFAQEDFFRMSLIHDKQSVLMTVKRFLSEKGESS